MSDTDFLDLIHSSRRHLRHSYKLLYDVDIKSYKELYEAFGITERVPSDNPHYNKIDKLPLIGKASLKNLARVLYQETVRKAKEDKDFLIEALKIEGDNLTKARACVKKLEEEAPRRKLSNALDPSKHTEACLVPNQISPLVCNVCCDLAHQIVTLNNLGQQINEARLVLCNPWVFIPPLGTLENVYKTIVLRNKEYFETLQRIIELQKKLEVIYPL